jgi:Bacterial protein of unknown function (DUF839)
MIALDSITRNWLPATLLTVAISSLSVPIVRAQHVNTGGPQVTGLNGYQYTPLFTVGETITGTNYTPIGILDGIGALDVGNNRVRALVNHEVRSTQGAFYKINPGTANELQIRGARISYFDIDQTSRQIVDAGLAYDRVYDRSYNLITSTGQFELSPTLGGLDRFCSGAAFGRYSFGTGIGFEDTVYFAGEETTNGSQWVLDVVNRDLWAAPEMGRGAWENWTEINTSRTDRVALIGGDDTGSAPLYLYIGEKNSGGDFLDRNGLKNGRLYVWKADNGDLDPRNFSGTGSTRAGKWVEVDNTSSASELLNNYPTANNLRAQADTLGAFSFSRPEDVATNPRDGSQIVLASTGSNADGGADLWGTVYIFDNELVFDANGDLDTNATTVSARILYDGNDAGDQFASPDFGLRSPDNLDWSDNGVIYIQEDRSFSGFGQTSREEASIWRLNSTTGQATRVGQVNRSASLPDTQTDGSPNDLGNWETSGILDVTNLFPTRPGEKLFILDVQAHSVRDGSIAGPQNLRLENLVEGGQLGLFSVQTPEPTLVFGLGIVGVAAISLKRKR